MSVLVVANDKDGNTVFTFGEDGGKAYVTGDMDAGAEKFFRGIVIPNADRYWKEKEMLNAFKGEVFDRQIQHLQAELHQQKEINADLRVRLVYDESSVASLKRVMAENKRLRAFIEKEKKAAEKEKKAAAAAAAKPRGGFLRSLFLPHVRDS